MPGGASVHRSQCHPALAALNASCIDSKCLHMVQLFLPLRAGHALYPFIFLPKYCFIIMLNCRNIMSISSSFLIAE